MTPGAQPGRPPAARAGARPARPSRVGALRRGARRGLLRRWRSSLQLRVVVTTTALGLLVAVAVGTYLLDAVADGLVEERRRAALADAARAAATARAQFDASTPRTGADVEQLAGDVVSALEGPGPDRLRGVLLLGGEDAPGQGAEDGVRVRDLASEGLSPSDVPATLRRAVTSSDLQQAQLTDLPAGGDAPTLLVGSTVTLPRAGQRELYFAYSLTSEERTIDLVRTTFAGGGLALVVLVGTVAWVVTRLVVQPVREAAGTAERLAGGHLDERMRVRGSDDLARLGSAFNAMAAGLQQHIGRLEELSRLQQRFVSDVSHELRTPLTTIRMAGEVLFDARAGFEPVAARSAELLMTQLERFDTLLSDLLEISRFDAGAAALEPDPQDVRALVHRVVDFTAALAERRGSTVLVSEPASPCTAEVDARRIERVLRNLLGNAVEHGESRPIEVTVVCDESAVAVGVRDHGVGLAPSHLLRVFDRFWRADPARARTTGGSGLGLAIALEDTRLHGGRLEVWGHPGHGCHFVLTVPRAAGRPLRSSPLPVVPVGWREPVAALSAGRSWAGPGGAPGVGASSGAGEAP
ncbi:MtrAB system histidine kinase MtrB [Paenibacillus sp. TRM 82003]|uniref:MtrAB system histidine kinase MtrB n=1 Tax=Kineococcus sp. TRM81007 TaxID=2925831 RepID=UPI001F5AF563|nr:MtrAB system histidine kinase MtrB [Kineococcus sp. TRM81007]MCI2237887.1 MtrAB system histidine kinase MtrB [Kineococcus sp. TRM81007]MCI3924618.1 MtrAB system histidine kinase MtrB [Paenibacillus sp. TRM 82003]